MLSQLVADTCFLPNGSHKEAKTENSENERKEKDIGIKGASLTLF